MENAPGGTRSMFLFVNNHQGRKYGRNKKIYLLDTVSLFLFLCLWREKSFLFVSLFVFASVVPGTGVLFWLMSGVYYLKEPQSLNWYPRHRAESYSGRRRDPERNKAGVQARVVRVEKISERKREEWLLSSCDEDKRQWCEKRILRIFAVSLKNLSKNLRYFKVYLWVLDFCFCWIQY